MASSDTCFNSALLDLEFLMNSPGDPYKFRCRVLSSHIRNLRTFHLFARTWGNDFLDDYENDAIISLEALLVEIEDAVSTFAQHIHPFCVGWEDEFPEGLRWHLRDASTNFDSFKEEIKRWYIKFSDCSRQSTSSCSSGHLVEFIDSILSNLNYEDSVYPTFGNLWEALEEELTFFKNFIRLFTPLQGGGNDDDDDGHLGQNLLTHIKDLSVGAAYHSYMSQFITLKDQITLEGEITELQFKISELRQMIKPVYQICIQSLNGLKLSKRQPHSVVTLAILQNFIASLIIYLFEILKSDRIPVFSNKNQLHILYEGLSIRVMPQRQSSRTHYVHVHYY